MNALGRHRWETASFLAPFSLAVMVLLLFGQSLSHQLVWDDQNNIIDNPALRLSPVMSHLLASSAAPTRLLANLSFALEYRLWGLNPLGYHATNLCLHLVNTLLVYIFALGWPARPPDRPARLGAWVAGLLFAVHPVHVETVNSLALGRGYLLATAFALTALCLAMRGDSRPWRLVALAAALIGAALSHELGLSATLFVAMIWYLRRRAARRPPVFGAMERAALLCAGGGLVVVLVWAAIGAGHGGFKPVTMLPAVLLSVKQLILPMPLCLWYDARTLGGSWPVDPPAVAAVIALGVLLGVTARMRHTAAAWCVMLFGASLAPVLVRQLLPFPLPSLLGERWLYLPSVFLAVWIGMLVQRAWEGAMGDGGRHAAAWAAVGGAGAVAAAALIYTAAQTGVWRGDIALFEHAVRVCPSSAYLRAALGKHYFDHGEIARAGGEFTAAAAIDPGFPRVRIGMGLIALERGDVDSAIHEFSLAKTLAPADAEAYNGLGESYFRLGRYGPALAEFQRASALRPSMASYHWNLAATLGKMGRDREAIAEWEAVLAVSPHPEERATAAAQIQLLGHAAATD